MYTCLSPLILAVQFGTTLNNAGGPGLKNTGLHPAHHVQPPQLQAGSAARTASESHAARYLRDEGFPAMPALIVHPPLSSTTVRGCVMAPAFNRESWRARGPPGCSSPAQRVSHMKALDQAEHTNIINTFTMRVSTCLPGCTGALDTPAPRSGMACAPPPSRSDRVAADFPLLAIDKSFSSGRNLGQIVDVNILHQCEY